MKPEKLEKKIAPSSGEVKSYKLFGSMRVECH